MKKLILILFTFHFSLFTLSAQSWLWARQGKNHTTYNDGHAIAIDKIHNTYLTGSFTTDTLLLGTDTLLIKGPNRQAYLIKYDENGNLLWKQTSVSNHVSGNGKSPLGTYCNSVATDLQNNVYITGDFFDTAYFQSQVVENHFFEPLVFVAKYNANGNLKWVKQCTKTSNGNVDAGEGIVTDKSGNVYVTGYFGDTVSFSSFTLRTLYASTFLVKYDSNGNVIWAKQSNSINHPSNSDFITIDKLGYIYISGNFQDTIVFGSHKLISHAEYDAFLVKYDSNGNVIWAKQSNAISSKSYAEGYGICTDKENNIYTTGYVDDTVVFGATTLISPRDQSYAIYWAKYDSSGTLLWAKQSYNIDSMGWNPWDIGVDASENVYLTCSKGGVPNYWGKAEIVFDADTFQVNHTGGSFLFIKMDSSGTVTNGYMFPACPGIVGVLPLFVDSSGCYVFFGGDADTSAVLGKDTIGTSVDSRNVNYPFIARWSNGRCTDEGISTMKNQDFKVTLYPNPNNGKFTIESSVVSGQWSVEIYNMLGEEIVSRFSIVNFPLSINISNQPSGIYLYRIIDQQSNLISSGKFIIQ